MSATDRYPRAVGTADGEIVLERMTPGHREELVAFARALPRHDLLFLRRDITHERVVGAWADEIEAGTITSLLARRDGRLVASSAVVTDPHSFSPHVGELRVLVSPDERARGLGRVLVQESFLVALDLDLDKLSARMTADQTAAIAVFEDLGFRGEALLRDHVIDADGDKHDIVILGRDVERAAAQHAAFGVDQAF